MFYSNFLKINFVLYNVFHTCNLYDKHCFVFKNNENQNFFMLKFRDTVSGFDGTDNLSLMTCQ